MTIEYTKHKYTNIIFIINRFTASFPNKIYSQGFRFILLTNKELDISNIFSLILIFKLNWNEPSMIASLNNASPATMELNSMFLLNLTYEVSHTNWYKIT